MSDSIPKDTVILHALEPGKTVPNTSPFILKLETFMRMAKIPYMVDRHFKAHRTRWKDSMDYFPQPEYLRLPDHCGVFDQTLENLKDQFHKSLDSYLYFDRDVWGEATEEQKAVARSLRIVMEEHLYWGMLRWRVVESINTLPELVPLSPLKFKILKTVAPRLIRKRLNVQGLGRHDWETCVHLTIADILNFSTLLADKPFFLGEEPCEADCAFFGILANLLWASFGSPYEKAVADDERLTAYCERMKAKFWPDWDDRLAKK